MKAFLALLALLLVLFAVGIGLGARDDGGRKADPAEHGWLDALTRPFRPGVEAGAVRGPCLAGRLAAFESMAPCTLEIAPADEEVRTLELSLERGSSVEIDYEPEGGLDVEARLRPGRTMTLSVPREGASLTLACASEDGCRVRLD
jgi:hypothetical protein